MRLIKISAPEGKGDAVIQTAFASGIKDASLRSVELYHSDGRNETCDVVDLETSTPKAKKFIEALLATDYYDRESFSISTRQPRSIISSQGSYKLTIPLVEPDTDIFQELWQFSHITWGFAVRIVIAGALLSVGLIRQQILLIVAGLLFLPLLPVLMSIGFGAWTRQWKLMLQGIFTTVTAVVLLTLSGAIVALLSDPPLKYNEFNSLLVSALISLIVGIAAALANTDDAGRRELIGLAATSQIAILPVWLGVCAISGLPVTTGSDEIVIRVVGFFVNIFVVIGASLLTYKILGALHPTTRKIKE